MDAAAPERQPLSLGEVCACVASIVVLQAIMFIRGAPGLHGDASAYLEPGFLLAWNGVLAGPATQHQDLLYTVGFYSYPPGFFLLLAAWTKAFGAGVTSLLAFTHVQHAFLIAAVFVLVRTHFGATRTAASLTAASLFPLYHHGRPDVTSLCFAATAWLLLPARGAGVRAAIAGALVGGAVLVSPGYGSSAAVAIGAYALLSAGSPWRGRLARLATAVVPAIVVVIVTVAAVLYWQDAWAIASCQWTNHLAIRGAELNRMPSLANSYALKFCLLPLGLATVVPAVLLLVGFPRSTRHQQIACFSFFAGLIAAFLTNKAFLLFMGHFGYLGRPVLHAALASAGSRQIRLLGYGSLAVVIVTHTYLESRDYILMAEDPRPAYQETRALVPPDGVVATDGPLFPVVYRPYRTISYEVYHSLNRWEWYRQLTPPTLRAHFDVFRRGPQLPDVVIISTGTLFSLGPPDPAVYRALDPDRRVRRRVIFGITLNVPVDYYRPVVFVRRR